MSQNAVDYSLFIPPYLANSNTYYAVITDIEGIYTYVNPHFKHKFHELHDSFIGLNSLETIYVEDHPICIQAIKAAMLNPGKSFFAPLRKPLTYSHNQLIQTDWEFTALSNDKNELIGIMCIGKDASKRKQLLNENFILNTVFQTTEESIFHLNAALEIIQKNKVAEQTFKLNSQNSTDNLYDYFDSNFIDEFTLVLNNLRATQEPQKFITYHQSSKRWFAVRITELKNDIVVSLLDITAEKEALLLAEEKTNFLNSMLESSVSGLLIIDTNYTIKLFNEKALAYNLLVNKIEIRPNTNLKAFAGKENYAVLVKKYEEALRGSNAKHLIHVVNNDEEYWFNHHFYPMKNEKKEIIGVTIVIVNATRDKHHENRLIQSNEKLQNQNEQLQKIAWFHSHEVRRPLANIMEMNELFNEIESIAELRTFTNLLNKSCFELDAIIHNIDKISSEIN